MVVVALMIVMLIVILFLSAIAVLQIKMAGMEVRDFWTFVKANDTLDKLYAFSKKYEQLSPQQQVLFLHEAEKVFSAFDKVPDPGVRFSLSPGACSNSCPLSR